MYKLESKTFKGVDVNHFISYHRWDEIVNGEYLNMVLELSRYGEIMDFSKDKLLYIKDKVIYGGYEVSLRKV